MAPIVFRGVPVKSAPSCARGHPLKPCASPVTKAGKAYTLWMCDMCQRQFDIARSAIPMHCAECEFDACDVCLRPSGAASWVDIPLVGVSYAVDVLDFVARVELRQEYSNTSAFALDTTYEFPLDTRAAVCAFRCEYPDGRVVVGEARELAAAREEYAAAATQGHGAYLAERTTAGTMRMKMGNLPAGSRCTVVITYTTTLSPEGDADSATAEWRLTIPLTLVPKYTPPGTRPDGGVAVVTSPAAGYACRVVANFYAADPAWGVGEVTCPTHAAAAAVARVSGAHVAVQLDDHAMDRDVVLAVRAAAAPPDAGGKEAPLLRPMLAVAGGEAEAAEKEWAVAVPVVARFTADEVDEPAAEFVFVVDCSGSMAGAPIAECARTLRLLVQSLPPSARATMVRFGSSTHFPLNDGGAAAPLDAAHRARLLAAAGALKADLGGTELLAPLAAVYGRPLTRGVARQVFVLTDGAVSNTQAVVALAGAHAGSARTFTVGVGGAVDHALCDGVATAGGGSAIYVVVGGEIAGAVVGQVALALRPALADVRVHFSHPKVRLAGAPPPIFLGRPALLFATAPAGVDPAGVTMTLSAAAGRREVEVAVPLAGVRRVGGSLAGAVLVAAAAAACRAEEAAASFATDAAAKARVVAAATRWGLATSQTAFVAVETRPDPTTGGVVRVDVPLHHPATHAAAPAECSADLFGAPAMPPMMGQARGGAQVRCAAPASVGHKKMSAFGGGGGGGGVGGFLGGIFGGGSKGSSASSAPAPAQERGRRMAAPGAPPARPAAAMAAGGAMDCLMECDQAAYPPASFSAAAAAVPCPPPPPPACSAPSAAVVPPAPAPPRQSPKSSAGAPAPAAGLDAVIAALGDDGLWPASAVRALGLGALPPAPAGVSEAAWATAVVLAALEARHAASRAEWQLVARRAGVALRRAVGGDSTAVMAAATAAVAAM